MNILHLNIEITAQCNQQCIYCFNDSGKQNKTSEKTVDYLVRLLEFYQKRGLQSVLFTGGEPFVFSGIVSLIEIAQRIGLQVSILSNGFRIAKLVPDHISLFRNLAVAQISLDSINPEVHNFRRGNTKAWHDATSAIDALSQLGVDVEISTVLSEDTVGELPCLADYAIETKSSLLLRPLTAVGRAKSIKLSNNFEETMQYTIAKLKSEKGVNFVNDRFLYAPVVNNIDKIAFDNGIITITNIGNIRNSMCKLPSALITDGEKFGLAA